MILFDYIGNRACEEVERKFIEYLNRNELQNILLKCFEKADVEIDDSIKSKILKINSEKIKPNMSKEEIENNLQEIFYEIIGNNENYDGKFQNITKFICSEYLNKARKDILELYHIMDVLDDVKADITKLIKEEEKQQETSKKINDLHTELLLKRRGNEIHFIDELDDSKVFFYCEIEICEHYPETEETLKEIFEQIEYSTSYSFTDEYIDEEFFYTILITFEEPLVQCDFRDFLDRMNTLFSDKEIFISRITTHF